MKNLNFVTDYLKNYDKSLTINDLFLILEDSWDWEEINVDWESANEKIKNDFYDDLRYSEDVAPEVEKKIKVMESALNKFPEQFLENLFGTYVKVMVTRNGIETEEYDAPY